MLLVDWCFALIVWLCIWLIWICLNLITHYVGAFWFCVAWIESDFYWFGLFSLVFFCLGFA